VKLRRLILALIAGLAVPFVVPALAADKTVAVNNNSFLPRNEAVTPGDSVTWEKSGTGIQHDIVWEDGAPTQPASGLYSAAWTASRDFPTAGEYRYRCEFHSTGFGGTDMSGTIYVNEAGTVPAAATTPTNTQPTSTTPTNTTGTTDTTGTDTDTTPADTDRPSIDSLGSASRSFCRRRSRTCRRPGLRFSLELSEAAELRGVAQHLRRARRSATRRSFTRAGRRGLNVLRVPARGLVPGRYRLTLRAIDAAGNSSPSVSLTFRVRP
jgi:plastocyanin